MNCLVFATFCQKYVKNRTYLNRSITYLSLFLLLFLGSQLSQAQRPFSCFAISDEGNPDVLFIYNSQLEQWEKIGSTGISGIEALAYDPFNRIVYSCNNNILGTIDTLNGDFTPVITSGDDKIGVVNGANGSHTIRDIDGLTFDPFTGTLWASERRESNSTDNDYILKLNPTTGKFIPDAFGPGVDYVVAEEVWDSVQNKFVYDVDDISLDPYKGDLYAISNQGGAGGMLTILNKTDGTPQQIIGSFQGIDDIEALGFYNRGGFFGSTGNNSPDANDKNKFFIIEKNNAAMTQVGPIDPSNDERDFEACDCLTGKLNYISGRVYDDANKNQQDNSPEVGVQNVVVELYRDIDSNAVFNPNLDFPLLKDTTDVNGEFNFGFASTGHFVMKIDTATIPIQYDLSTDNLEFTYFFDVDSTDFNNDFGLCVPVCDVEIEDIAVRECYEQAGSSQTDVIVTVSWRNAPPNDSIAIQLNGTTAYINPDIDTNPSGESSPRSVIFTLPANNSSYPINVSFVGDNTCSTDSMVTTPEACPIAPDCTSGDGEIGGLVFSDYDMDGEIDSLEFGVSGIMVIAYGTNSVPLDTAYTDQYGKYTFTGMPDNEKVRIEFHDLPSYLSPSLNGNEAGTTVQFVTEPACNVNLGVNNPSDYCQVDPPLTTNCYIFGNQLSTDATVTDVLVSFPYNAGNDGSSTTPTDYDAPMATHRANANEMGTTFGLAYQRQTNTLFATAFMKRFTGFGPNGTGAIYQLDTKTGTISEFLNVDNYFGADAAGADPHPNETTDWFRDNDGSLAVGKVSFGDLDISSDDNTLYTINLATRELYEIQIGVPATAPPTIKNIAIPFPTDCDSLDVRPFAVKYYNGLVYVGITCTGESTTTDPAYAPLGNPNALRAYVYTFDPATGMFNTTPVLDMPLNYPRECADVGTFADCDDWAPGEWNAWIPGIWPQQFPPKSQLSWPSYPMPWLTDIEFNNGDMILGIRDYFGDITGVKVMANPATSDQISSVTAGDILKACPNNQGGWTIETNASCWGENPTNGVNKESGPNGGEFYWDDFLIKDGQPWHPELTLGGLYQQAGANSIVATAYDAIPIQGYTLDGGIIWFNNATGKRTNSYRLFDGTTSPTDPYFGKANGLGDLEAFCDAAPLEIGNYVWIDADGDGIQDPEELPLANISVTLYDANGDSLTTVQTDANGEYYFNDNVLAPLNDSLRYNTTYYILVGTGGQFDVNEEKLNDSLTLTIDSVGMGIDQYLNDSNGELLPNNLTLGDMIANLPFTTVVTGEPGSVDHSYDFGFSACTISSAITPRDSTICIGDPIDITCTGGTVYYWSTNDQTATITVSPTVNTTYYVTITNGNNCATVDSVMVLTKTCCEPPKCLPVDVNKN